MVSEIKVKIDFESALIIIEKAISPAEFMASMNGFIKGNSSNSFRSFEPKTNLERASNMKSTYFDSNYCIYWFNLRLLWHKSVDRVKHKSSKVDQF